MEFDRPAERSPEKDCLSRMPEFQNPQRKSSLEWLHSSAQNDETRAVTTNSPSVDSFHPDDQIPSRYVTRGFKPFSILSHFPSRDLGPFCVRYCIKGITFNCLQRLVLTVEVIIVEENSYSDSTNTSIQSEIVY